MIDTEKDMADQAQPVDLDSSEVGVNNIYIPEPIATDDGYAEAVEIDEAVAEQLLEKWGDQFDVNLDFARQAVSQFADAGIIETLEITGLGNDPRFVEMAASVGRALKRVHANSGANAANSEQSVLAAELEALVESPGYWSEKGQNRARQIHVALHGDDPVPLYKNF